MSAIAQRAAEVRERIADAAARAGRDPGAVRILVRVGTAIFGRRPV
jgi:uncharacterized pyridoxal phosphate-containing UPF0001 family protein